MRSMLEPFTHQNCTASGSKMSSECDVSLSIFISIVLHHSSAGVRYQVNEMVQPALKVSLWFLFSLKYFFI